MAGMGKWMSLSIHLISGMKSASPSLTTLFVFPVGSLCAHLNLRDSLADRYESI